MSEEQNTPTVSLPKKQPQPADLSLSNQKPTQEKKSNKWLLISLAIFALAVLGVVGFFAYQNYQLKEPVISKKDAPISSPTPMPTEVLSPTPTIGATANWLSYADESVCYTFKYPQEITFKIRPEEKIIHLSLWGPTQKQDTEFYDGISLSFSFPLEIGGAALSDYVDSQIEESKQHGEILKSKETITINGINGYTYTSQGLGTFQNIFLQSPDKTCTVEITNATADPSNQGYQKTVDKILSTFKFVD